MPVAGEVENVYKKMTAAEKIEIPTFINRAEFLTIMFKVTQDGDD